MDMYITELLNFDVKNLDLNIMTKHLKNNRIERLEKTLKHCGEGQPLDYFYVDKKHKNGPEIHVITNNALIYIYNYYSFKLITILIARPGQINRYYRETNKKIPDNVVNIAKNHQIKKMNSW